MRHLIAPVIMTGGKAVYEDERRVAGAPALIKELYPVDIQL
jgi:hypothetical protein